MKLLKQQKIDLNNPQYTDKLNLTKENLLKFYSDYDYIKAYFPHLEVNTVISSPFRKDDHPSFSIFYSKRHNCLLYKDFKTGDKGDFVMFIQKMLIIYSYKRTLQQIAVDFNLQDWFLINSEDCFKLDVKVIKHNKPIEELIGHEYDLKVQLRAWNNIDLTYWRLYGISLQTLKKYNVFPIRGYFHNKEFRYTPLLSYAYVEIKDEKLTYKVYRPFENKRYKWRTNHEKGVHQGYRQLPLYGDLLIITKSLKDVMSLYENLHINAIAVQAETVSIKDSVMDEYKNRFDKVMTLFDNDEAGSKASRIYYELYGIPSIFMPLHYVVTKDFSDLICNYGITEALEFLVNY